MAEKIKISIKDDVLTISLTKRSLFLDGMHRIFISNVMGLEELEDTPGYFIKSTGNLTDILIELVTYFKEENAVVEVDEKSENIVTEFNQGTSDFELAKEVGKKSKEHPVTSITVPSFKRTLKPYQIPAVSHMVNVQNAANFSVPGSGKTTVTLAGYSILKSQKIVDQIVIVGPRASFMSWEDEYENCFGFKTKSIRLTGPLSIRKKLYRSSVNADIILISYQMAGQDVDRIISILSNKKTLLVLDESHYIKRIDGGKWANAVLAISPFAVRRVILTGTPVPNSLDDLWSQLTFLWPNPKILGTADEYKDMLTSFGASAQDQLKDILFPFYWRIHKSELNLKDPKFHRIKIQMRPYQQAIYDAIATKVLSELVKVPKERTQLRTWRKAKIIRLMQVSSNPTLLTEFSHEFEVPPMDASGLSVSEIIEEYPRFELPPKIDAVIDLVNKLIRKKEKVIIWTSFIHNIETLVKLLSKHKPRFVYGDVPKDKSEDASHNREQMIRDFKESPKYNLFIANPSACAESVSLHKICHHAIYLDRTFNCAHYMQSLDRIHRIGLSPTEQVHYYIFQSKDSIDEVIDERLIEKQRQMLQLLNDDFALLNLESSFHEISDDNQEDVDFNAIVAHLKARYE